MNSEHDDNIVLNEESMEAGIIEILSIGLCISVSLLLMGGAMYLGRHGLDLFLKGGIPSEQEALCDMSSIINSVLSGHGRGVIQLGLIALVFTPIARVTFTVVAFIQRKDWNYAIITSTVLAVLIYGLLGL